MQPCGKGEKLYADEAQEIGGAEEERLPASLDLIAFDLSDQDGSGGVWKPASRSRVSTSGGVVALSRAHRLPLSWGPDSLSSSQRPEWFHCNFSEAITSINGKAAVASGEALAMVALAAERKWGPSRDQCGSTDPLAARHPRVQGPGIFLHANSPPADAVAFV